MMSNKQQVILLGVFLALFTLFPGFASAEDITKQEIYVGGEGGYAIYRIPALVVTTKGTILAFAEARKNGPADHGEIDIVVRRSLDNGTTWEPKQLVYTEANHTIGNPSPVVDRETGAILLLFNRDNSSVLISRSDDDGATWSKPKNISRKVKRPGWTRYAMGPGHAIQLQSGRILVPCDHSVKQDVFSHVIYSDNHGKTWKLGGSLPGKTDEANLVELDNGSVMITMRNYFKKGTRAVAVSQDSGRTWSQINFAKDLIDPECQGSILRFTDSRSGGTNRLIFSNPASKIREKMTIKLSYDEGQTWPVQKLINPGLSGYSDLAVLTDMSIGILFECGEKNPYERIVFSRLTLDQITNGKDSLKLAQ